MKCVIFTVLLIIAVTMAAPREKRNTCSPLFGLCHVYEDCCRHLICSGYQAKCIPKGGLVIPGQDKRPLGPGPYPDNVPSYEFED